ncbi:MAG TPA: PKD domain-containing protein [Candidatus Angelobacter sp.]|nr:PKD domain-containing protein [Candidatus Angelobacter sp.]
MKAYRLILCFVMMLAALPASALERTNVIFKIFQFPADKIPRIDGQTDDWDMVPDDYAIGTDQLVDDTGKHPAPDPKTLNVSVKVGWVKGLNRLYFLYQAYDDYWDFSLPGLHNDTFELVVDGDLSGGPLIERFHPAKDILGANDAFFSFQGVHAQNYHIFTPAEGKDWCMAWDAAQWIKDLPYANAAYSYDFKPGQPGKLTLEFWITPFDYAGYEGPRRAVESVLAENKIIGMSWAVIDYDDVNSGQNNGFWNLSRKHTMYGNASELCAFKLMPLEPRFRKPIEAQWSFKIVDMDRRLVAFKDLSEGKITSWKWDFGDGETSTEQNPIHAYKQPGQQYVVTLWVEGPAGKSRRAKVWAVSVK